MEKNVNLITLIGKIGSEPRYDTPHDTLVCDFHFITEVSGQALKTNGIGEKELVNKTNTQEFNVRLFNKEAEKAKSNFLKKGEEVCVEGYLELQVHLEKEEDKTKGYIKFMARDYAVELWVYGFKLIMLERV